MECNKCGTDNIEYNNYCSSDGTSLMTLNKKYVLNQSNSEVCQICNSKIEKYNNYCNECGSSQNQISRKKSITINSHDINNTNTKKEKNLINNISISNIKSKNIKIDFKRCLFTALLILVFISLSAAVLNGIWINELESISTGIKDEIPTAKLTLLTIVSYNITRLLVNVEMNLLNFGSFTFSNSGLVGPTIVIISSILSTIIVIKNNKKIENLGLNASIISLIYSAMILMLALISKTNMISEEVMLTIKVDSFMRLFINSFVISFIGCYIGIHIKLKEQRTIYSKNFISSINTILCSIFMTVLIAYVVLSSIQPNENMGYFMDSFASSLYDLESKFKFILALLISPWLFTISNFSAINIMDIKSYSLIDLFDLFSPMLILIVIVLIICFLIKGSTISSKYNEHNHVKIISIYSLMYSLLVGAISYASTLYMSFEQSMIGEYLNDIIYEISYMFEYSDYNFIQEYIDQIYSVLETGISIGPGIISSIIGSFIFSYIFVFIGYKIKNMSLKEGEYKYE